MSLPFYKQHDSTDCGPACLRMVARYYGRRYTLNYLREKCFIGKEGVSLRGIQEAAEICGFRSVPVKIPFRAKNGHASLTNAPLPAILHWNDNHFRSEEHTSELQSRENLVCRLLLEKKKKRSPQ